MEGITLPFFVIIASRKNLYIHSQPQSTSAHIETKGMRIGCWNNVTHTICNYLSILVRKPKESILKPKGEKVLTLFSFQIIQIGFTCHIKFRKHHN